MKKQIILLAAMLLLNALATFANQMPKEVSRLIFTVEKSDAPHSLNLRLANLQKKRAFIELRDVKGNTWFTQHVNGENGYAKRLNLNGMPDGTYTLSVAHEDATFIQALHLSNGVLEVLKHQKMEVPAPLGEDLVRRN